MGIVLGFVSGIISGLGVGGGSVLILCLVNFMNLDQHIAQATNLFFFVPTAIAISIMNYRQKLINLEIGTFVAVIGLVGAILGANFSVKIESENLKKYFGIFLLIIVFYEIYGIIKAHKNNKKIK